METGLGVLLAVLGGVMVGNCMLPLNYLRGWRWENAWIVFSLVALVFLPWILAFWRVTGLLGIYSSVKTSDYAMPFLFGAGWGVAQVLFGLAVVRIGMAVTFAVTLGLSAVLGSLAPILLEHAAMLKTARGSIFLAGMGLMIAGIVLCSAAGRRREKETQTTGVMAGPYAGGIFMAVGAGLLAPMLNYSLAFGDVIIRATLRHGVAHPDAPYALWPIVLAGGALPNLIYAIGLLWRNRSWARFLPVWPEITLGAIMGGLWMGSLAIYGTATTLLGIAGAAAGWSLYQICIVITANVTGWIAGEWRGISSHSRWTLWCGLLLLVTATVAIAYGNS